jgi:hypothetical protein
MSSPTHGTKACLTMVSEILEQLIDQQENQLEQINTVIATLKAQKNTM